MFQRPFARRRGTPQSLVSPALLLLLVQSAACGVVTPVGEAPPGADVRLAREFPRQAPAVLGAGRGFALAGGSFAAEAEDAQALRVELPGQGEGAIVFRGAGGFEARVSERGPTGAGRVVDRAVTYGRAGGASFWTTTLGGVEEWLHVAAGSRGQGPIASWEITGAALRAHGAVVDLVDAAGVVRVRVTAPAAYAASGRPVVAHLRAGTSTLELLADGGGEALLVDPIWKAAASMSGPRYDHRAALVGSGKVLASGGTDGNQMSLDTASLYDPTADAWTDVGPMTAAHVCHTATELTDGTVLVVGGMDDTGSVENGAETYAEATGFTAVGSMSWNRLNHAASRLTDGRVLVTGGVGFPSGVAHHWILGSGSVTCWEYGVGGCGGPGATSTAEIYDPALQGWVPAGTMNNARERHTQTNLPDGTVLVTGGETFGYPESSFEIYSPTADAWTAPDASLTVTRADHTATLLPSGDVLLTGGTDGNVALASAEILPAGLMMNGVATMPMSTPRTFHTATLLADGTVLIAGGTDGNSSLGTAEIYDPATKAFTPTTALTDARSEQSATSIAGGTEVLVVGGVDPSGNGLSSAEIYVATQPNGAACTVMAQCSSGFCTQGVCCDTVCAGAPCQACAQAMGASADGTCTPVNGGSCVESPCTTGATCNAGACTSGVPKVCAPIDSCHEPGTCDATSGACPTGVAKLDGSACTGGVCIAGACVPDPTIGTVVNPNGGGGGGAGGATTGSGAGHTGTGGSGGSDAVAAAELTGSGCGAGRGRPTGSGGAAGLLLGLLAALYRRRGGSAGTEGNR